MLMTATLYSLRKLRTDASWGSTAAWLRFHMVTGLVGPYMVLLHTAMRFHGLAGLTMLLTVSWSPAAWWAGTSTPPCRARSTAPSLR